MPDTTTDPEVEHDAIRAQVTALRDADPRGPIAVHLGTSQRASLEAYVRLMSGQADVGPLLSFQGLEIRLSKKADHIALLYAEGDDPDPPDAPAGAPAAPAAAEVAAAAAAPAPATAGAPPSGV